MTKPTTIDAVTVSMLRPLLVITLCLVTLIVQPAEAQQSGDAFDQGPVHYRSADDAGFEADIQVGLLSSFVFRGRELYKGVNLQPSIQPSYSFGKYGSLSGLLLFFTPLEGTQDSETYFVADEGLAYDFTYSRFTFSLGQYWYGYPRRASSVNTTSELWTALSLDTALAPSFRAYWDYDAFDSLYYEIALKHTFQQSGEGAFNLTVFSNLGFASHAEGIYEQGGLVQVTSGASTDLSFGPLILRPSIAYTGAEDGAATTQWWGGISVVWRIG